MTDPATITLRAQERAQRRFRRMLDARSYGDPTSRTTRLYVQAERLIDRLRGEEDAFELNMRAVDARMDALHEATHADLDDLAAFPDIPLAAITESELRALDGYR
jgi:hypothetical protein